MKKRFLTITLCVLVLVSSLLILPSCASGKQTVMTVGDYKVSYDMLRYFVMNYMNGYEDLTPEDFENDEELQKMLYNNVVSSISELATYSLLAKEHDISLTKEQKQEIKEQIKELKNSYKTKEEYKKDLENNFVTEAVFKEILTIQALCDNLYDKLTNEYTGIFKYDIETIDADIEAGNFFSAEYIVMYYTDDTKEERIKAIEEMLKRAENGEKMSDIADEGYVTYGEHLAYELYPIFTYTEKNEIFEDTVSSLDINSYSDVIDMASSAMIVRRLELDMDYINENYNTVIAKYLSREFFGYVEQYSKELDVNFKDKYKDIKLWEIE